MSEKTKMSDEDLKSLQYVSNQIRVLNAGIKANKRLKRDWYDTGSRDVYKDGGGPQHVENLLIELKQKRRKARQDLRFILSRYGVEV